MIPKTLAALMLGFALGACSDKPADDSPYLKFEGGGFMFNYRLASADYGFIAKALRELPEGSVLEARLENPSGGEPFVITQPAAGGQLQYAFRTPPVQGVKANRDYHVELRLLDAGKQKVIATYTKNFRSDVDQEVLPEQAPVKGPGYQPNPELKEPPIGAERVIKP